MEPPGGIAFNGVNPSLTETESDVGKMLMMLASLVT
jgi:hypothetical protein